jgi:hypothetical protein
MPKNNCRILNRAEVVDGALDTGCRDAAMKAATVSWAIPFVANQTGYVWWKQQKGVPLGTEDRDALLASRPLTRLWLV